MARHIRVSKFGRGGWFGEPYRHYLASKGVKSGKRYFVRNFLKGNRDSGLIKSLYAQGYSKAEAYRILGLPGSVEHKNRALLDVPDKDEVVGSLGVQSVVSSPVIEPMPLVNEPVSRVASQGVSFEESRGSIGKDSGVSEKGFENRKVVGVKEVTPGVPPPLELGFNVL